MNSQDQSNSNWESVRVAVLAAVAATVGYLPFAWLVGSLPGVVAVLVTGLACVIPVLVGLAFSRSGVKGGSLGLLAFTGARIALVFVICVVAKEFWPALTFSTFFLWVVLVYLTLLVVDTVMLLRSLPLTRKVSS